MRGRRRQLVHRLSCAMLHLLDIRSGNRVRSSLPQSDSPAPVTEAVRFLCKTCIGSLGNVGWPVGGCRFPALSHCSR